MQRLNIYVMHSTKFDYNNLLYKQLLSSNVCLNHNLILPYTKDNQTKYAKDLINKSNLIIAVVSNPNFGLYLELTWLLKVDKPKLFISFEQNIPSKYKNLTDNLIFVNEENLIPTVEKFIKDNNIEIDPNKDDTITLGEI